MLKFLRNHLNYSVWFLILSAGIGMVLTLLGCNKQESTSSPSGPKTFASREDAGKALEAAANSGNSDQILQIFGPASKDIISSGDATEDKSSLDGFAKAYQVMNRWRKLGDGSELLLVGTDNQAFPIPLVKNPAGEWYFDAAAGKDEILSRRIGSNELATISVCEAIADAQAQYFDQRQGGTRQYAQKFISDSGQQNGLYWESAQGPARSPLGPLVAYASSDGYKVQPNKRQPFYGYYYVMLDKQGPDAKGGAKDYIVNGKMTGGFAVVAYPAHYGDSGIMTFLVDKDGVVFQKDLGKDTDQVAAGMAEFNPDKSWAAVD